MFKNWKTSLAGIGSILGGIGCLIGGKVTEGIGLIATGVGLLAASDSKQTNEVPEYKKPK